MHDSKVCQRPVKELENILGPAETAHSRFVKDGCQAYQAYISGIQNGNFRAVLADELILEYRDGRFEMRFTDRGRTSVSAGRGIRYADIEAVENVTILTDVSSVEVFVNNGEYVFSTRYYPEKSCIYIEADGADIKFSKIV